MCLTGNRARVSNALLLSGVLHALSFCALLRFTTSPSHAAAAAPVFEVTMLAAPQPASVRVAVTARRVAPPSHAITAQHAKPLRRRVARTPIAVADAPQPVSVKLIAVSLPPPALSQARDSEPVYLDQPLPRYPGVARRRRLEGVVLLRVAVAADGMPLRVELQRSSGHAVLDEAACAAVRAWRFVPASRDGHSVRAEVQVPIRFRLASAE